MDFTENTNTNTICASFDSYCTLLLQKLREKKSLKIKKITTNFNENLKRGFRAK